MVDVGTARRKLIEALNDNAEKYWNNMKLWYKQKITKDDFDTQAYELLGSGKMKYHNEFILSILAKCQSIAISAPSLQSKQHSKSSSKSLQLKRPRVKRHSESGPVQSFEEAPRYKDAPSFLHRGDEHDVKLCTQNLVLPDVATLYGRLFLGALDADLESISDESAHLLVAAVEAYLKNVLTACVSRRKAFVIRSGGHFQHRYGASHLKTHLQKEGIFKEREAKRFQSCDQAEAECHARFAAGEVRNAVLPPISLPDLRGTIMGEPNVVASHTVRAANVERITANSWHPGHDEIKQNGLYLLENRKLHERLKQRALRV